MLMNKNKSLAFAGSGIIGLAGIAGSLFYVNGLTTVVVTAGENAPVDGAIEWINYSIEGVAYTMSLIPLALASKIVIAGVLIAVVCWVSWEVYKAIRDKQPKK